MVCFFLMHSHLPTVTTLITGENLGKFYKFLIYHSCFFKFELDQQTHLKIDLLTNVLFCSFILILSRIWVAAAVVVIPLLIFKTLKELAVLRWVYNLVFSFFFVSSLKTKKLILEWIKYSPIFFYFFFGFTPQFPWYDCYFHHCSHCYCSLFYWLLWLDSWGLYKHLW